MAQEVHTTLWLTIPQCRMSSMFCSPVAQLVEYLTVNQGVPGSSPGWGAKHIITLVRWIGGWPSKPITTGSNPVRGSKSL